MRHISREYYINVKFIDPNTARNQFTTIEFGIVGNLSNNKPQGKLIGYVLSELEFNKEID